MSQALLIAVLVEECAHGAEPKIPRRDEILDLR